MNTLQEEIKPLSGYKRTFLLMRIAGLDTGLSMRLVGVSRGTYNSWFNNGEFSGIYHKLPQLMQDHRQEAIQMLRRDNQLEAVLLEGKILQRIKEEIESGELSFCKTNLAREVYSKLMTDLDASPKVQQATWQQRIDYLQQNFLPGTQKQIEGGMIDAEFEEVGSFEEEHQKGKPLSESQSPNDEDKE